MIQFKKEVFVNSKEELLDVEDDSDDEEIKYSNLDDEREHHWRFFLKYNDGEVDDKKTLLHVQRWIST